MLQDIATHGRVVISDEVGLSLEKATLNDLGEAKKIVIEENTTIIDGAGKAADIKGRIESIRESELKRPLPTMTRKSCRSALPSSPAVLPSSRLAQRRKSR